MIEAAEDVCNFAAGRTQVDLDSDRMLYLALVRAIEIIGEAASKVSAETRRTAPAVPWRAIISMRNRVIHAYVDINRATVWRTATEEVPRLLPELRALLAD
jgi:uncharacterized protein with HEPN domain